MLNADQLARLGSSREKFPDWIGSMVPNDEDIGYQMAKQLITLVPSNRPAQLLAFSGSRQTPAATLRNQGLRRALLESPHVQLVQRVYSDWNRQRAYEQMDLLLPRYPDVQLVWAANDEMAFGAMGAAREHGRRPGQNIWFSGLNNSEEVLQARIDGQISVLASGHFTLGGWALVLIHDYAAGLDFAQLGGKDRQVPLFMLLDVEQSQRLLQRIKSGRSGVNFRDYSRVYHPQLRHYNFSLQPLLH
jgi:ABC-type sugar transport system substrate-binding protein